jgi:ribosomal protein L17
VKKLNFLIKHKAVLYEDFPLSMIIKEQITSTRPNTRRFLREVRGRQDLTTQRPEEATTRQRKAQFSGLRYNKTFTK